MGQDENEPGGIAPTEGTPSPAEPPLEPVPQGSPSPAEPPLVPVPPPGAPWPEVAESEDEQQDPPTPSAPPPGAQVPSGYPPPPYYAVPVHTRTNGFAIASLVLGILWVWWIGSILALIFGYVAKGRIDRSDGRETGRGLAVAGIVLGWIGVCILVLSIISVVVAY